MSNQDQPLSPILLFWIPVIWLIGQLSLEIVLDKETTLMLHRESGVHEIIQFLLVLVSCALFAKTLIKGRQTTEFEDILGYSGSAALIHRDDMSLRKKGS
ncbi:MAG: hypothetical protein AAGF09_05975 [Pseudomonadota bacterium]